MFSCLRVRRQLNAYLDGELSPKSRTAVERHLVRCKSCRSVWESLNRLGQALQVVEVPPVPPSLTWQIMAKAREDQNTEMERNVIRLGHRLATPRPWAFKVAAAAVLVFGLAVGSYTGRSVSQTVTAQTAVQADPLAVYNLDCLADAPSGSLADSYLTLVSATDEGGR
jgi:anti-sigma factor RsiW